MSRTVRRVWYVATAAACGLVAASCHDVTGPKYIAVGATGLGIVEQPSVRGGSSRRVAIIGGSPFAFDITVPERARAGEAVELRVTTYGGSCIRDDSTVVRVAGSEADVVPYQSIYSPTELELCAAGRPATLRAVSLVFPRAGTATVTITGRAYGNTGLVQVVRRVVVE